MGRIGINFADVETAASQLTGRGKIPTVDAIRDLLATGSKSTIAQHLKVWKAKQADGEGNLPKELFALVTGLWERLNVKAEQRITDIRNESEEKTKLLQQTLTQTQNEHTDLKVKLHQIEEAHTAEQFSKKEIESQLRHHIQEHDKLLERHQAISKQFQDTKADNIRLHELSANIQKNLEHYQNSMQKLRTEQNLAIEKQQVVFQKNITDLQQQIASYNTQYQESENRLNYKTQELDQCHEKYNILQSTHENLVRSHQKNIEELIILRERLEQSQIILKTQEQILRNNAEKISELDKQVTLLSEKNSRTQTDFKKAEEKIENLRHEKTFLIQEKSELQGYLKKLGSLKG